MRVATGNAVALPFAGQQLLRCLDLPLQEGFTEEMQRQVA